MVTESDDLGEFRTLLRRVMRGLWQRRRPSGDLFGDDAAETRLTRRHVAVLTQIGSEGGRTVGDLARELGLSLPATSKLTRELEDHGLVQRREDPDDRRRTVVELNAPAAGRVRAWLARRNRPLERTLAALTPGERDAFLKGLRTLADALMEESGDGPLRSHHRAPHRRRPHRHRPL